MEREGEEEVDEDNDGYGNKELFRSSSPDVKKKSLSQLRREKARREKRHLEKAKNVSVKETVECKSSNDTKTSEVIEEVFPKNVSVKESVDNKSFKETTFSEVMEEGLSSMRTVVRVSKLKKSRSWSWIWNWR